MAASKKKDFKKYKSPNYSFYADHYIDTVKHAIDVEQRLINRYHRYIGSFWDRVDETDFPF